MSRLSATVIADHQELREYYAKYQSAGSDKAQYANLFRWKLAIHTLAEDMIVYPVMEREMGAGVAAQNRKEHAEIKADLAKLESTTEGSAEWTALFEKLFTEISSHFTMEETTELTELDSKVAEEESNGLATRFERTRKILPTYISNPPFPSTAAMFSAPPEKLRELFATVPEGAANK